MPIPPSTYKPSSPTNDHASNDEAPSLTTQLSNVSSISETATEKKLGGGAPFNIPKVSSMLGAYKSDRYSDGMIPDVGLSSLSLASNFSYDEEDPLEGPSSMHRGYSTGSLDTFIDKGDVHSESSEPLDDELPPLEGTSSMHRSYSDGALDTFIDMTGVSLENSEPLGDSDHLSILDEFTLTQEDGITFLTLEDQGLDPLPLPPPGAQIRLGSGTMLMKRWFERNIDRLGNISSKIGRLFEAIYGRTAHVIVAQAKIGNGFKLGQDISGWGQIGFQMVMLSQGSTLPDSKYILKFFLHNQAGMGYSNATYAHAVNNGVVFKPGPDGKYHFEDGIFTVMTSDHLSLSATYAAPKYFKANVSTGVDAIRETGWTGKKAIAAAAITTGANVLGNALGYLAGSAINQVSDGLQMLNNATAPTTSSSTNTSTTTSSVNSATNIPSTPSQYPPHIEYLMASLGGMAATSMARNIMDTTQTLHHDRDLVYRNIYLGPGDLTVNIPIGSDGVSLAFSILPRFCQLDLAVSTNTPREIIMNPRITPRSTDDDSAV